jgi:hypothetical protein
MGVDESVVGVESVTGAETKGLGRESQSGSSWLELRFSGQQKPG